MSIGFGLGTTQLYKALLSLVAYQQSAHWNPALGRQGNTCNQKKKDEHLQGNTQLSSTDLDAALDEEEKCDKRIEDNFERMPTAGFITFAELSWSGVLTHCWEFPLQKFAHDIHASCTEAERGAFTNPSKQYWHLLPCQWTAHYQQITIIMWTWNKCGRPEYIYKPTTCTDHLKVACPPPQSYECLHLFAYGELQNKPWSWRWYFVGHY